MTKMNVESFNLDHTKVVAPFIRLAGTMEGLKRRCHSQIRHSFQTTKQRTYGYARTTFIRTFNG